MDSGITALGQDCRVKWSTKDTDVYHHILCIYYISYYCHSPTPTSTSKNKNRAILRKQKLLVYVNKAQKSFQVEPQPKDSPIGPKKAQNDHKKAKKIKESENKKS